MLQAKNVEQWMKICNPADNPQVYFILLTIKIKSMLKMKDKQGKFKITVEDVRNLQVEIEGVIKTFKKKKETDWYGRIGVFAAEWEAFCLEISMPILGISVLKKAIKRIQSSPTEFTNCHKPFLKLCW